MKTPILTVSHEFHVQLNHAVFSAEGGVPIHESLDAATDLLHSVVAGLADLMQENAVSNQATLLHFTANSVLALLESIAPSLEPEDPAPRSEIAENVECNSKPTKASRFAITLTNRLDESLEKVQRAQDGNSRTLRNDAYTAIPSLKDVRAVSRQVIADKVVRDIQPHLYLNAERKANRDAFNFASKNRWQEAAEAKQRELLNHYLYREATAARKEEEKIYTFMRRFEKPSTRERIGKAGASYLEQIEGLLDQYEFRKVSGTQVERRRSLAQFVSEQEAAGNVVNVPQHLIEQSARVNYRDLTFEELNGVRDAVVNIEHLARLKNKLLNRKDKRDYEQARSDLIRSLNDNVPVDARKVATSESSETTADKAFGALAGIDASLTRMENVINRLDGRNTSGPWHELVWNPLAEAQANERTLFKNGIRSIVEKFAGMDSKRLADRFYIPSAGKSFNRREILMHALNTGNESNRTKLLKGNKLNDAALADMLGRLEKQDWDLVQSVWDSFDNLWPDIAAMYKRLSGVAPPRIEPKPVNTAFGEYRGGYFPIMYDRKRAGARRRQLAASCSTRVSRAHCHPTGLQISVTKVSAALCCWT
ncbi:hypothetical protein [Pseudomonas lactucae]|uniref:hypothetical protein n=1 Tax=Pseudomonas lactucae TaxID=2813360 RepID=UPI00196871A4|nr:hypothetical protein [Pseudomonas lactucae]MBN2987315.1 hypothetical protein [Pseudomonas lactucae]